jgi:hypothetical protein
MYWRASNPEIAARLDSHVAAVVRTDARGNVLE